MAAGAETRMIAEAAGHAGVVLPQFLFVLEQTQGHVAHSRNLERLLDSDRRFEAAVLQVRQPSPARLGQIPLLRSWSWQASRSARAGLKRRLKQRKPDALLIHTQVAALLAAGIMRDVPTVISMDATPKNYDEMGAYQHGRQQAIVERFKTAVNSRAFRAARAFAPWSRWAADSLVRDYNVPWESVHVIRPGVDLTIFRPRVGARRPGPVRILFVGGDFERKGGRDLLDALAGISEPVELHAVTKSDIGAIPAPVSCHVYRDLEPQTSRLIELFRDADLFVLPTRAECYGLVIPEAMACGLPVVSSPIGAIPELVHDGMTGYLVPARSPVALRDAIQALVHNPDLRVEMGATALATARREHDVVANYNAIVDLLFEIARPS
jgi:glycosyltransferase involved in cell wall biosynthesis